MNRFINLITAIVISTLFLCTPDLKGIAQEMIPETSAGQSLSAFIESINNSDEDVRLAFLKDGFEENDEETLGRRKIQTDQLRSQLGELAFERVVSSSKNQISAACSTSNGPNLVLTLTITDDAPYKIKKVELELGGDDVGVADEEPLDAETRALVVERLAEELRSKYVYPEVGEKMAVAVETSASEGEYDDVDDVRAFASQLTDQLREICSDLHLRVRAGVPHNPGSRPGRRPVDNHGFVKAEMLPGAIGYLKFNFFSGDKEAEKTASAAMNFLANSDALIFDLRDNGGGSPAMIAFLSSYLFEDPVHLNSFYNRPTDTTTETWTQKDVPGKKFSSDTPVFVLTSSYTFSGAEEFSYNLKNLNRGVLVGETTGGGAHPVMPVVLGSRMHITMPFARAINPVTKTNWEGVGVKPHVEVSADLALEKAIELAKAKITEIDSSDNGQMGKTETANVDLDQLIKRANDLMQNGAFADAAKAFEKITELEPNNGEACFRYGYCLHANGELDKAIEIHKKAAEFDQFAGIATYNLACAYSLKNQADESVIALEKAIELGFGDVNQIERDSDFDNVRKDERFSRLIKKLKNGD